MDNEFYEVDIERTDEFLAHHGIKGMSWGVQNGPPYPLSAAEHKKVINKAKIRDAAESAVKTTGRAAKKVGNAVTKAVSKTKETIKDKKEQKEAEEREQEIRESTPRTILENKAKYSDEELIRIANRLSTEKRIADLDKKETTVVGKLFGKAANDVMSDVLTATSTTMVERLLGTKTNSPSNMIREEFSKIRKSTRSGVKNPTPEEIAKEVVKVMNEREQ